MKISKILNNNSAVVLDDDGSEIVVMGKAVAFKKKVGDSINPAFIEKKFCLSSQTLKTELENILVKLPLEEINIVNKIVNEMRMRIARKTSDSIYISLSDHIHYALKNHKNGIKVTNNLMYDIQRFYKDEYLIGKIGLDIIEEETGVRLAEDEAGFIALHIVNAEISNRLNTNQIEKSTKIINEVLNIVVDFFKKNIDESSLTYFRFINHLKYFSWRVMQNSIFNDDREDDKLLCLMKHNYPQAYLCAKNIQEFIRGRYTIDIGNEEMIYLVIHIQRAFLNDLKEGK